MKPAVARAEGKLIVFRLASERYGLDVLGIREIMAMEPITRVPGLPPFIKGLINLRGVVVPVIDLRLRFGVEEIPYGVETRIIDLEAEDGAESVGVIVDEVEGVIPYDLAELQLPSPVISDAATRCVAGVLERDGALVIVLDRARVLERPDRSRGREVVS
ncbi:MAG: chemotaxis protein CheW [Bacillota bacterium]